MNRNKYRNLFLALHGKNERLFSREIQKAIKKDLKDVNYNLDLLVLLETQKAIENGFIKYGKQIGSINYVRLTKDQKRINPFFSQLWQNYVIENSRDLIGTKITTIKETLITDVRKIIETSNNIFDISKEISTFVNKPDFYKWQSLRIARTETTIAMNTAVNVAGEASGVSFVKRWLSAGDGNERESHAMMNGTTTTQQGQFGNGLSYPGDPNGTASEIINCRCTFLQEPIRDKNREPIVNYKGDQQYINLYRGEIEKTVKDLDLQEDLNVVFKKMNNGLSGSVAFKKQADGTYKMGNLLEINTDSNKEWTSQIIKHELKHINQSQKEGFMIKDGYFYFKGEKNISVKQYNTILKGAGRGNKESLKKYLDLPWELDADNYAGIIRNKSLLFLELQLIDLIELPKELQN